MAACGGEEETTTTAGATTTAGEATTTTAPPDTGSTTTGAPSGEMKTLKIGTIMSQTGPLAILGLTFTRGWDLYADDVNNAGGVKIGNDTYTIEFIHEDSKGSAEGAGTAASKLVNQDKVDMVIGGILESEMAAINQVTEAAGIIYVMANANIPGVASGRRTRQAAPGPADHKPRRHPADRPGLHPRDLSRGQKP